MPETTESAASTRPEPETLESWHMRVVRGMTEVPDHSFGPAPLVNALLRDLHNRVAALEAELCQ